MSLEDVHVTGITKMTGASDASCARDPSRCHPADAATVRLVKLIEHTTEETDSLYQVGSTQKVQGSGLPILIIIIRDGSSFENISRQVTIYSASLIPVLSLGSRIGRGRIGRNTRIGPIVRIVRRIGSVGSAASIASVGSVVSVVSVASVGSVVSIASIASVGSVVSIASIASVRSVRTVRSRGGGRRCAAPFAHFIQLLKSVSEGHGCPSSY